ncbi:signal peptidase I [Rubrobacter indicoceani]|uniref:signal peptidase I n=1 Tax=Rubrobacter indicoceani TaxID=2051957 RepID=UPI000E5B08FE|nr:signal peptidase I [Rubrobacter indicoceani]
MSEREPKTRPEEEADRSDDFETRNSLKRKGSAGKSALRGFLEFFVILVVSFVLVFGVVRPFIVEAFWIPSESMVPTLQVGDRVLVNKFIYRFKEPERGDILVFKSVEPTPQTLPQPSGPFSGVANLLPGGSDPRQDLIKRVVGVAGDEIRVQNGRLFVNGELQNEPYVNTEMRDTSFYGPFIVPEGHVFMMGDNRANSQDSRVFGPVPQENIEGEAFLLFWPPGNLNSLL